MKYAYPVIFTVEDGQYLVSVPDLKGCHTFGDTLPDAIEMARDAMSMWLCIAEDNKENIPAASVNIAPPEGSFIGYVDADTLEYRRLTDSRAVKKTLTVPSWLNTMAEKANINFSQVLQEALRQHLHI
jgi:predicted RNase H-like HicB family nuclease